MASKSKKTRSKKRLPKGIPKKRVPRVDRNELKFPHGEEFRSLIPVLSKVYEVLEFNDGTKKSEKIMANKSIFYRMNEFVLYEFWETTYGIKEMEGRKYVPLPQITRSPALLQMMMRYEDPPKLYNFPLLIIKNPAAFTKTVDQLVDDIRKQPEEKKEISRISGGGTISQSDALFASFGAMFGKVKGLTMPSHSYRELMSDLYVANDREFPDDPLIRELIIGMKPERDLMDLLELVVKNIDDDSLIEEFTKREVSTPFIDRKLVKRYSELEKEAVQKKKDLWKEIDEDKVELAKLDPKKDAEDIKNNREAIADKVESIDWIEHRERIDLEENILTMIERRGDTPQTRKFLNSNIPNVVSTMSWNMLSSSRGTRKFKGTVKYLMNHGNPVVRRRTMEWFEASSVNNCPLFEKMMFDDDVKVAKKALELYDDHKCGGGYL